MSKAKASREKRDGCEEKQKEREHQEREQQEERQECDPGENQERKPKIIK